ncbi:hypothetical protein MMC22_003695 [Lobaria immixta]|nr:hypothetical protein [Lobaria immixta]
MVNRSFAPQMQTFNAMSLLALRAFSLFLIVLVLAPFHPKHTPFALAVDSDFFGPDPRYNDANPRRSDYPDDRIIRDQFEAPPRGQATFWADIDETTENLAMVVRYCQISGNFIIGSCFPFVKGQSFLGKYFGERAGSDMWYRGFRRRAMQIYINYGARGEVKLISRPGGPSKGCTDWHEFEFQALKQNNLVDFITLLDPNNLLGPGTRYWTRGDPDPPNSPSTRPAGPNDDGGNVIRLPQSDRDPRMDRWNFAGTALFQGGLTPAVLAGGFLPAAAAITKIGAGADFLHGLSALNPATPQGQFLPATSSDQWTGIDSFGLGKQSLANIPGDSFGKQPLPVLPDASKGSALSPRDEDSTCSIGAVSEIIFQHDWNPPAGSVQPQRTAKGGSMIRPPFSMPPVGNLLDLGSLLSQIPPLFPGTVLKVDVIQTLLPQTAKAVTYRLDVTVVNGDSKQVLASQSEDVDSGLKLSVGSTELQTPMFVWWDGSDLLHFREGGAGQ